MLDLVLSVATILLSVAAGALAGLGVRGRMPFRAEPLCARCRSIVVYEKDRPFDRCGACGATLGAGGLLYFRHRWIWSFLVLSCTLGGLAIVLLPLTAVALHLVADGHPLPTLAWLARTTALLAIVPFLPGYCAGASLLTVESPTEPRCRECTAPLDPQAIFDRGGCSSCKATFLDAGPPRPAQRVPTLMRILCVVTMVAAAALVAFGGFPTVLPTGS